MEKVKLTVVLDPDEAEKIKAAAKSAELSASEFCRRALLASLAPRAEAPKTEVRPVPIPQLNAAARLDGLTPPTVTPRASPPGDFTAHPCASLRPVYPAPYDRGSCQGSCADPRQTGRPCFWAANAAPHCPLFQSRGARSAPRSA